MGSGGMTRISPKNQGSKKYLKASLRKESSGSNEKDSIYQSKPNVNKTTLLPRPRQKFQTLDNSQSLNASSLSNYTTLPSTKAKKKQHS